MLRPTPPYTAGVNTANLLDPNNPAPVARGAFGLTYFDPSQPASRAEEWNVTLEREILPNTLARIAWVATRLWPSSPYGTIEDYRKTGYSLDNSLLLQLERRFSKGMAFQAFYVMNNATRLAGNGWYDDFAVDPNIFIP